MGAKKMTEAEQELKEAIAIIISANAVTPYHGANGVLALIQEAGYKSPKEVVDLIMVARKSFGDDCERWCKANGYVKLDSAQDLPLCFPHTNPEETQRDMLKAGWRKVEVKDG